MCLQKCHVLIILNHRFGKADVVITSGGVSRGNKETGVFLFFRAPDSLRRIEFQHENLSVLLMEEILRRLVDSLSHYLQEFIHPGWCRISSINRMK